MAGIIDNLVEVLEQEKECYEGLLTLANYKAEAVMNKKLELISEIVGREEAFIGRVNMLEKRRESLIKDIALVTGMDYKSITVTKLVDKLGKQVEVTEKMLGFRESILQIITQLKAQNEINVKLLEQSLELVDFTVNALQSTQAVAPNMGYGRPGDEHTFETRSFFDTKQ